MNKIIVFCADGTWDSPENSTNVYKLYKAIPISANQVAFYDDGVGADGTPIDKLAGGAFGVGLFQKIKDGYTKICHVYEAGDEIFIFGFSRGAFTARSLAGMIAICGLPTGNFDDNLVNTAFEAYRNPDQRAALLATLKDATLFDAKITMVGVWDTVGSLGIPALLGGVDKSVDGFLDTNLHPDVLNAYQALAVDERRQEFPPTLWNVPAPPVAGQTLEQVWFAGVHCDVGGGYPETGLSDITLGWMMGKANDLGLQFDPIVMKQYTALGLKNALGQIHESWNIMWLLPKERTIAGDSPIGNSVELRCEYDSASYQPANLMVNAGELADTYQLVPVVAAPAD
jgi:uncharacterized protein (DUF2235 family)